MKIPDVCICGILLKMKSETNKKIYRSTVLKLITSVLTKRYKQRNNKNYSQYQCNRKEKE